MWQYGSGHGRYLSKYSPFVVRCLFLFRLGAASLDYGEVVDQAFKTGPTKTRFLARPAV